MLGQPRTTQRRARKVASDEGALRGDIVRLASRFGRYGYRRVTDMLRIEGWGVKHKRVERIWRQEGLKVPQRGRLWLEVVPPLGARHKARARKEYLAIRGSQEHDRSQSQTMHPPYA